MAQTTLRGNLSASSFPLLSEFSGRGIVIKQYDQNYVPTVTSKEDTDQDVGVPGLLYCENIFPTATGYQSVGFNELLPTDHPTLSTNEYISHVEGFRTSFNTNIYFGISILKEATYPFYYYVTIHQLDTNGWDALTPLTVYTSVPTPPLVTYAVINGVIYAYIERTGCYTSVGAGFTSVTLTGLVASDIIGITSCQGYMVAWSNTAVYWSSLLIPTDFIPSLSTGAGGGQVQAARGELLTCVPHTLGFMIYTTENIVAVPYSGNSRYPFNFREVPSSHGLLPIFYPKRTNLQAVTLDPATGNHYAFTTAGLQLVTMQTSNSVFPEVSDFLFGRVIETFNSVTNTITVAPTYTDTAAINIGVNTLSDRYLVISYGFNISGNFTQALIYDSALKRWGKIVIDHICVAEVSVDILGFRDGRNNISFVTDTGTIYTLVLDTNDTSNSTSSGVAIIGKYQLVRSRMTSLQEVEVENVKSHSTFSCHSMYTLDGKNFQVVAGALKDSAQNVRTYNFHKTGKNHSLLFKGAFNLVSFLVTLVGTGGR